MTTFSSCRKLAVAHGVVRQEALDGNSAAVGEHDAVDEPEAAIADDVVRREDTGRGVEVRDHREIRHWPGPTRIPRARSGSVRERRLTVSDAEICFVFHELVRDPATEELRLVM